MAHDREVLRMIWEGQIGICFQADRDEIVGIKPEPFYLMISRLSYLPLVTDKVNNWNYFTICDILIIPMCYLVFGQVRKYFSRYISAEHQDGAVWFDFNGTPLRLHYPIGGFCIHCDDIMVLLLITNQSDLLLGVLYDLLHPEEDGTPWSLTIHFSKFPEDALVKLNSK